MSLALALALGLASGAFAQQPLEVRRGEISVRVKVTGTVVTNDLIRLRAPVEGRVEDFTASTYTWVDSSVKLGSLSSKEMAAIYDSYNSTQKDALGERWERMYQATTIRCPSECFILRTFIKPRQWLKPQSIILEAARGLQMVGRVRPEDAQWVRDGQKLEFWPLKDTTKKLEARIAHYVLDVQGSRFNPGGSFTMDLSPSRYLEPGTEWEGYIVPTTKKDVLIVPTGALIDFEGNAYLPIRVSTGITTDTFTEVAAGVANHQPILVLDDSKIKGAFRHKLGVDDDAMRKRIEEEYLKGRPEYKGPKSLPEQEKNYGEDPYGD